jgi:hypothetical protein
VGKLCRSLLLTPVLRVYAPGLLSVGLYPTAPAAPLPYPQEFSDARVPNKDKWVPSLSASKFGRFYFLGLHWPDMHPDLSSNLALPQKDRMMNCHVEVAVKIADLRHLGS